MNHCGIDFAEARDPLGRDMAVDHTFLASVFGVPVRFESNSRAVIDVATDAFGDDPCVNRPWRRKPLTVRVVVYHCDGATAGPIRVWSPDPARLLIQGPDRVALSDPARRSAVAYVACSLVADRAEFRQSVLEHLTFAMVDHYDRFPVHAAAITGVGGDTAVLLSGPSGAGKSTLAYAAHLAGLTVVSDDIVWVQLRPRVAVWGPPRRTRRISLLPDARDRFPTLALAEPMDLPNGKRKLSVPLDEAQHDAALRAERAVVCLLTRSSAGTVLTRTRPETIAEALEQRTEPGFDRFPTRVAACARALAGTGGWQLAISSDVSSAVPCLVAMLEAAERTS